MVGTAGQLLERSIVDVSVGSPERLVFEGAPVVVAPLAQDASERSAQASRATAPLDSRKAVPDLTAAEEAEYRRLVNAERARLKPEAKAEQKRWIAREGAKLGPDGERIVKAALAKRTLSRADGRSQFDDDELGTVTIDDVMVDPARYDGETLADPLDGIDYGAGQGQAVRQRGRLDRRQQLRPWRADFPAAALGEERPDRDRESRRRPPTRSTSRSLLAAD